MKRLTILAITLLTFSFLPKEAKACDSCNFFEYSLLQNRSYFGLFYRHRSFGDYTQYGNTTNQVTTAGLSNAVFENSAANNYTPNARTLSATIPDQRVMHEPEGTGLYVNKTKMDWETYETVELRGNFMLKNNWNFAFLLPYESNVVYYEKLLDLPNPVQDTTISVKGWGDLTLAADYIHYIYNPKARHTFRPGIAITAPTGQSRQIANAEQLYDPIIQPGTGSWSLIGRMNYQLFYTKTGANLSFSYKTATEGSQDYQFGNSFNGSAVGFHQFTINNDWILVPNLGGYFEHAANDTWEGEKQALTGGDVVFAQAGTDLNIKDWTLSFVWQTPLSQSLNGNQILHKNRLSIGVIKSFKL
ncbi:hypothetical protein [Cyclobacterium marinum]|uniref:hypothetical protein n=1 Tax=Cyclobacterium marinum TaxID=104 RepID=UPI0011EB9FF0|nr:hypothetical protein [Cyclobacterium marinum]MBI0398986.1 hypothetical protein [Cyclobacterium marinum]